MGVTDGGHPGISRQREGPRQDDHVEHMLKLGLRLDDPESNMLGALLRELPDRRQMELADEVFLRVWKYDDRAVPFLETFERICDRFFEGDKVTFRAHLMSLYNRRSTFDAENSDSTHLKLKVFEKIIEGWPNEEDAEYCFDFFCKLQESREMWKRIDDLFRNKFRRSDDRPTILDEGEAYKKSRELLKWLAHPSVPIGIYNAINCYRLGLAGREVAEKEARILKELSFGDWSIGTLDVTMSVLGEIRQTNDMAQELRSRVLALIEGCDQVEVAVKGLGTIVTKIILSPEGRSQGWGKSRSVRIREAQDELVIGTDITIFTEVEIGGPTGYLLSTLISPMAN